MILIIGTRTFRWGSARTDYLRTCPNCGYYGYFTRKKQIRTLALFFVIPIFPLGGVSEVDECPNCHMRFEQG